MPNRVVHRTVGIGAGAAASAILSDNLQGPHRTVELLAAAVGGYYGAAAPDWIDPPTTPNHRSVGHSIALAGGGLVYATSQLSEWRSALHERSQAAFCGGKDVQGYFYIIASGILTGFVAGYASHLALDAATPKSLPAFA